MITADGVRTLARYSAWQNGAYVEATDDIDETAWWEHRGAFFGSLGATANHILWADLIWLSRLTGRETPPGSSGGTAIAGTRAEWARMRAEADAEMQAWAEGLTNDALAGTLDWVSGMFGAMQAPRALAVMHLFNHATHHRGQFHAMLTAMGRETPTTDLIFMPGAA